MRAKLKIMYGEIGDLKVKCPVGETVSLTECRHCDHCRIIIDGFVKCSYADDRERDKKYFSPAI